MNEFQQPYSEPSKGTPPPPFTFSDAAYRDIFDVKPPSSEDLERGRIAKEQMEQGFNWNDTSVIEMSATKTADQEARAERLAKDQKAANDLSDEIKKAA